MALVGEDESLRVADADKIFRLGFGWFEISSFVIFLALSATAIVVERRFLSLFLLILVVDLLATLFDSGMIISIDRSSFLFLFIVLGSFYGEFGALQVVIVTLVTVTALDFSFLLRKVEDTKVSRGFFRKRLSSYLYTIVPSFLVTYIAIFIYSRINLGSSFAVLLLGLSSLGSILIVYFLMQSISSVSFASRKSNNGTSRDDAE